MTDSAIQRRGRQATELRIVEAAQQLADERGSIDGFTMDELAVAADVSRRTLFNYFPTKVDAVLGPDLRLPPAALDTFCAGGPHGDLIEDLQAVLLAILEDEYVKVEALARFDRIVHANPTLLIALKDRLRRLAQALVEGAVKRPGGELAERDVQVAVAVLAAVADVSITEFIDNPEHDFAELIVTGISAVRRLFG